MTILQSCLRVLEDAAEPMSAEELITQIKTKQLYQFKAQDPLAVLRATLRKHLRSAVKPQIREVGTGRYAKVD